MLNFFIAGVLLILVYFVFTKIKEKQQAHFDEVNLAFKAMLEDLMGSDALILDTETTGLTKRSEIVEISIINLKGEIVFNSLVKPLVRMANDCKAVQIHGITHDDLKDQPTWAEIHEEVAQIIAGKTVISYNAEFDTRLLEQTAHKHGLKLPHFNPECAMMVYSFWHGAPSERQGYKWHKLEEACRFLGVTLSGKSHRALTDCLSTLAMLNALKGKNIQQRKNFL